MPGFIVANGSHSADRAIAGAAFTRKGLGVAQSIEVGGWQLRLFGGPDGAGSHLWAPGGTSHDWAACVGTLLYNGKSGAAALAAVLASGKGLPELEPGLGGAYVIFLCRDGKVSLAQDAGGSFQVFATAGGEVMSTSFLAVASTLADRRPSAQELYEYVFYGLCFGDCTLFPGIRVLPRNHYWDLDQGRLGPERPRQPMPASRASFAELVDLHRGALRAHFAELAACFENSVTAALSGGYDSRLMLAILRSLRLNPHLYVYGRREDADVRVAQRIAAGEGFALEQVDKAGYPHLDVESWLRVLERDYYFFDALKGQGIFDNGSDYATRADRAQKARLQLNGAGGEIFRDFWNLPDRRHDIGRFLETRYDPGDDSFCADRYNRREFLGRLADKVKGVLGIDRDWITRLEMQRLYPLLRNRFAGANIAINNQLGPSLLPFAEPRFVESSLAVPLRFKAYGRFQAALIASLDAELARYPSSYGRNFSDPLPVKDRLRLQLRRQLPVELRLAHRRRRTSAAALPYYLAPDYRHAVFGGGELAIREFLDPERIADPARLARALTVELILRGGPPAP